MDTTRRAHLFTITTTAASTRSALHPPPLPKVDSMTTSMADRRQRSRRRRKRGLNDKFPERKIMLTTSCNRSTRPAVAQRVLPVVVFIAALLLLWLLSADVAASLFRRGGGAHHSWHVPPACFQQTPMSTTRTQLLAPFTAAPLGHPKTWQRRRRPRSLHVVDNSSSSDKNGDGVMENSTESSSAKKTAFVISPKAPPPDNKMKTKTKKRKQLRMQLFAALNLPTYEIASAAAVLTSSFLVAVNTLPNLPTTAAQISSYFDSFFPFFDSSTSIASIGIDFDAYTAIRQLILILDVFFCVDFFCRWYAAGQFKLKYLTKPLAVIDIIVVIIPLVFGSLGSLLVLESSWFLGGMGTGGELLGMGAAGLLDQQQHAVDIALSSTTTTGSAVDYYSAGLQNLLLLRILKLRRVLTDINTFARFAITLGLKPKDVRPYQLQLARALLSTYTLVSVASGLIYTAEHEVNPAMSDYFCALYFTLTTLTTVGLGDVVPVTALGRFFTSATICVGVAVIPVQAARLAEAFIAFQKDQDLAKRITIRAPPGGKNYKYQSYKINTGSTRNYIIQPTSGKGPGGVDVDDVVPEEKQFFIPESKQFVEEQRGASSSTSIITTTVLYEAKIDGKGPDGVDIEMPVKDKEWSPRKSAAAEQTSTRMAATATTSTFSMTSTSSEEDNANSDKMTMTDLPVKSWSLRRPSTTATASMTTSSVETSSSKVSGSSRSTIRTCNQCGATPHRMDAVFCWSCGQKLPCFCEKQNE